MALAVADRAELIEQEPEPIRRRNRFRPRRDVVILAALITVVLLVQGWNIADYPTVSDDEGTYLAQAWAIQHGHGLAPYTYWYDHPPAGWIQLAAFTWLPALFTHSDLIAAYARIVMLPFTAADVALLYVLAKRLSGSRWTAAATGALFALSPLSVTLQREVFLDNLAVFWILLAFVLASSPRQNLWMHVSAGAAAAIAVLSKETMLIALPGLIVALYRHAHPRTRKFTLAGFFTALWLVAVFYPVYALLKGELVPGPGHVSLVGGIEFQMDRPGSGSVFATGTGSWTTLHDWLYYDPVIVLAGVAALVPMLLVRNYRGPAVAGLALVLMALRPGYLPAMYIIQLLPFFALAIAGLAHQVVRVLLTGERAVWVRRTAVGALAVAVLGLVAPRWIAGDATALSTDPNLTYAQAADWMRTHLHPTQSTKIVVDDGLWLNAVADGFQPGYGAIWFYKVDLDPAVEAVLPHGWRSIQYVVSTPTIRADLSSLPTVDAALEHSRVLASFGTGAGAIQVRQVLDGDNS
ncbi:glycosyltransferase family 39 protein [Actinospica durhamensis]|uniref:Glycosyltransferase family 39 protein n=1 Tax=Actinospica durhamensis TaxID=1508375 RepID=A0A941EW66_9ACTN|nr:phospholipid carrier-dependent glycosyltransferase [Actinospica durhamensis]MBR7837543.1 glycosyltransferase family 39 protein [Actinospica durhamensis]